MASTTILVDQGEKDKTIPQPNRAQERTSGVKKERCSQARHCLDHPDLGKGVNGKNISLDIDNDNKYTLNP